MSSPQSFAADPTASPLAIVTTPEELTAFAQGWLARAAELRELIRATATADAVPGWDDVLGRWDALGLATSLAGGYAELVAQTHPEEPMRAAAQAVRPQISRFYTDLMLDPEVALAVRRYAETKPALDGVRRRLLEELLRDFRRNGLELAPEGQARLRELNDELTRLAQEFSRHIAQAEGVLRVPASALAGLPEPFLATHPVAEDGQVTLTTSYPDYFPVLTYCEDRDVAARLYELFDVRAADVNIPLLERVLELRHEKATLLGYDSWAAYVVEPRMARTPTAVREFLESAGRAVREPAQRELREFAAEHAALGLGDGARVPLFDRLYLENRLRSQKYGFDAKALSEHFEVRAVVEGALSLVTRLFGVRFEEDVTAPRWHADVRVLAVLDGAARVGTLHLDLYPRPNKFKHAAMFEIRPGCELPDGTYLSPMTALVCNFPQPGTGADAPPALLGHDEVVTFFHELGHGLHHLLTRQPLVSYSGTNTVSDFVETPSQAFEEWAYRRETLDTFARHHSTGEPIPDALLGALTASRAFGRALAVERQLSLARLDFEYHTRRPPIDSTALLHEIMASAQSFAFPESSRFQASFGHLMGYDAGYYGYQWALAIARDVLTRFEHEGFLAEQVARDYRRTILESGAGEDEAQLVTAFLGRPGSLDAYARYLAAE